MRFLHLMCGETPANMFAVVSQWTLPWRIHRHSSARAWSHDIAKHDTSTSPQEGHTECFLFFTWGIRVPAALSLSWSCLWRLHSRSDLPIYRVVVATRSQLAACVKRFLLFYSHHTEDWFRDSDWKQIGRHLTVSRRQTSTLHLMIKYTWFWLISWKTLQRTWYVTLDTKTEALVQRQIMPVRVRRSRSRSLVRRFDFFCSTDHLRVLTWVKEKKEDSNAMEVDALSKWGWSKCRRHKNVTYWICGTFGDTSRNCFHSRTEGKVSQGNNVECCNCGGNQFSRGLAIPQKQRIRKKGKRQRQHERQRRAQERERQQRPFPARGRQWEPHSAVLGRPRQTVHHKRRLKLSTSVLCLVTRRDHLTTFIMMVKSGSSSTTARVQLTAALLVELACWLPVCKVGDFIAANDNVIPNSGWSKFQTVDAFGNKRKIEGGDGRAQTACVSDRKQQVPRRVRLWGARKVHSKTLSSCKGLQREYQRLRELHGNQWILPPYREGWLYKCFPRCASKLEMALVEAHRASRGSSRNCVHQLQWQRTIDIGAQGCRSTITIICGIGSWIVSGWWSPYKWFAKRRVFARWRVKCGQFQCNVKEDWASHRRATIHFLFWFLDVLETWFAWSARCGWKGSLWKRYASQMVSSKPWA